MQSVPPTSRFCLRHEEEAEGPVSAVFRDVRRRMPFVPALFKALAFDPGALETAWLQARALYDDPRAAEAAGRVAALARPEVSYRPSPKVRATVAPFLAGIPMMLLVVSSLGLSLDGELELSPPPPPALPEPGPLPETPVPEERGEHPLFDEVRAALRHSARPKRLPRPGGHRPAPGALARDRPLPREGGRPRPRGAGADGSGGGGAGLPPGRLLPRGERTPDPRRVPRRPAAQPPLVAADSSEAGR